MTETVSVIIPTYNCARWVGEAIESALSQSGAPARIIVVNDGSTDETAERLKQYAGKITVIHQTNQGVPAARNAGLAVARGEWIAFLDADDAWHPRKLALQLAAAEGRAEIALIGTETIEHPREAFPNFAEPGAVEEVPLAGLLVRNYFAASSVMIRRKIVERIGGFDAALPGAEDLDYWQRAAECGAAVRLKLPLTGYRNEPGSLSRRPEGMEIVVRRIIKKLDNRGAWRGRRLLRRKAMSHLCFTSAYIHGAAGRQGMGVWRMIQSFAWYPLPYARTDTNMPMARPKRAAGLLLRLAGLKRAEEAARNADGPARGLPAISS